MEIYIRVMGIERKPYRKKVEAKLIRFRGSKRDYAIQNTGKLDLPWVITDIATGYAVYSGDTKQQVVDQVRRWAKENLDHRIEKAEAKLEPLDSLPLWPDGGVFPPSAA